MIISRLAKIYLYKLIVLTDSKTGRPLNGSGSFILGQKFSWEKNSFVKPDSFVGALHQVNVWRDSASDEYMWNAAHKCHWPMGGNINSWVGFLPGVRGNTKKRFPTSCKGTLALYKMNIYCTCFTRETLFWFQLPLVTVAM